MNKKQTIITRLLKRRRFNLNLFLILIQIKLVAIELAATIVFFVWLYRELIHELRR